jgi:hypothetical protein
MVRLPTVLAAMTVAGVVWARPPAIAFRPPAIEISNDHLLVGSLSLRGTVELVAGNEVQPAEAADLAVVPSPDSIAATFDVHAGRYELRATTGGTFRAHITSPTHPDRPAIDFAVRLVDPGRLVDVVLHPMRGDRDLHASSLVVEQDEFATAELEVSKHGTGREEAHFSLAPGDYVVREYEVVDQNFRRGALHVGGPGAVDVRFDGSRVVLDPDFIPVNESVGLSFEHGDGSHDELANSPISCVTSSPSPPRSAMTASGMLRFQTSTPRSPPGAATSSSCRACHPRRARRGEP